MGTQPRRSRRRRLVTAGVTAVVTGGLATPAAMAAGIATTEVTPTAAASTAQPLLREGMRGPEVRDWQATLNRLAAKGTPPQPRISEDGAFGPQTKAATQVVQRWASVTADGIVGSQTRVVAATAESSAALDPLAHLKPMLREGTVGTAVRDWQATLNELAARGTTSESQLAMDGVFGTKTKAATQAFQRWANIAADGIVGVQTYTAAAQAL